MTVTFTCEPLDDENLWRGSGKDHAVIIRQGDSTVKLCRQDLIDIFGTLKEMKKFFGAIG